MPYRVVIVVDDLEEARMVASEVYDRFGLSSQLGTYGEPEDRYQDNDYDDDDEFERL